MQKTNKSLLVKFLTVLCALCFLLVLAFGLVGCGEDVKSISKTEINSKGELVIYYTNGDSENHGVVVGAPGASGAPGAPGADAGTLGSCEEHNFVVYVAQRATCQVEEIKVNFCTECNGYKVVVGEKDCDVHGTWKKEVIEEDGATGDKIVVDYFESAIVELPGKETDVAGSCKEKQCDLCKEFLATHANTETIPVDQGVAICDNEYWGILVCSDCKNPILDADGKQQITKVPARGHSYVVATSNQVLDDKGTPSTKDDTYKVALVCTTCGDDDAFATATYNDKESSSATCEEAGYDVFTYSYETYDLEEKKVVTKTGEIKNDYPVQTTHTFKTGDYVVDGYKAGDKISYTVDNAEALDALIEAFVIELTSGQAEIRTCETYGAAVARCAVCDDLINVTINDAHEYGEEVPATCVDDAYLPCKNCDEKEVTTLATGHEWIYTEGSLNTVTANLECKVDGCNAKKIGVKVTAGTVENPTSCREYPITPYTTEKVDNGLLAGHKNYNGEIVVSFEIEDKTAERVHAYKDASGKVLFTAKVGDEVNYNADIAACIGKMTENPIAIEFSSGQAADCKTTAAAQFRCQECTDLIPIKLYGPHTEVYDEDGEKFVHEATCTVNGYYYTKCSIGEAEGSYHEVKYDTIKAPGHNFKIVNEKDFLDAVAANRNFAVVDSTVVAVKCEDCDIEKTATLKEIKTVLGNADSCAPYTTYTYVFEYAAPAEGNLVAKSYTVESVSKEGSEAHKVKGLEGKTFYNGEKEVPYEIVKNFLGKMTENEFAIEATHGLGANCKVAAAAVFRCTGCGDLINITVMGPHVLDGKDVPVAPTCTTDGYTYQTCTVADCGKEVKIPGTEVSKTGHNYTWNITGLVAEYDEDGILTGINYGTYTVTCANTDGCVAPKLTVKYEAVDITGLQDCCKTKELTIKYYVDSDNDDILDDGEDFETRTLIIECGGDHNYGASEKVITIDGVQYIYCINGNKYVVYTEA